MSTVPRRENITIRATDACPSPDNSSGPSDCHLTKDLTKRIAALERSVSAMSTAFALNDLGTPDFDGHRKEQLVGREAAKIMDGYKVSITGKLLWGAALILLTLLGSGAITQIQTFLKP